MYQGVIFDLDGTLWDSTLQILPAWNIVLQRYNIEHRLSHQDIKGCMGKTAVQIAQRILPDEPLERSLQIVKACCQEELIYLQKSGGTLYPHLEKTLRTLAGQHDLFIVSNCQEGYIETFLNVHKFNHYFKDFQWEGSHGQSKGENIRDLMTRNQLTVAVYVGDTQGDLDAADLAAIPFIHAAYGFGQVNRSVPAIHAFTELPSLCL